MSPTEHKEYKWDKNPPKIDGQLGIPVIVDKLLGILLNLSLICNKALIQLHELSIETGSLNFLQNISGEKKNGFFVEVGGLDGELHANTLLFELERNWTGRFKQKSSFTSFRYMIDKKLLCYF